MAHKILIFVPAFGQMITTTTFLTTHAIREQLFLKGIQGGISSLSFPDIAELRGMAMTIWYDTMPDSSHLLYIDADMGVPADMISDMILFDEPVVGTLYPHRRLPITWVGSGTGTEKTERRGNFMHVEGVGFGCTLIRRDCVTAMIEAHPEMIDTRLQLHPAGDTLRGAGTNRLFRFFEKLDIPDRGLISEDLSFCVRWGRLDPQKNKVWAAINYRITHVGPFDFSGHYLEHANQVEAQRAAQAQQSPPLPQSNGTGVAEPLRVIESPPLAPGLNGGESPDQAAIEKSAARQDDQPQA